MREQQPGDAGPPARSATPAQEAPATSGPAAATLDEEFSAFYLATVRPLAGFLIHQGAPLALAADIAQETMVKAYRRWTSLRNPGAWVHTVASRALIRSQTDLRERPVEELPEPSALLPRPDAYADVEVRHDLVRVLRHLAPRQRQVMAWTLSGFTPAEIAEELGMTPNAVSASLRQARLQAARLLGEGGNSGDRPTRS